jgi:hypothetical protein
MPPKKLIGKIGRITATASLYKQNPRRLMMMLG